MASFLDSLFGSFTGQPAIDAANAARNTLTGVYGGLQGFNRANMAESIGDVTASADVGRGAAAPFFGQAGTDLIQYGGQAANLLGNIYGAPLDTTAGMTGNALGLGGPGGNAAATAAFQTGPGYQFALEQGLDAVARNANAAGMGASGNMLREAQQFGQGLANQEYNRWLDNLQQREGLYAPLARAQADVYSDLGRNLGNLDVSQAQFYNDSFNQEAQRRANLRLGGVAAEVSAGGIFGPNLASTDLAIGAAQQQAGENTVGLISDVVGGVRSGLFSGR